MLLFIQKKKLLLLRLIGFNTSHVTLYLICHYKHYKRHEVSIHLMLLFIKCPAHRTIPSEHGFNTSHVTLYPLRLSDFRIECPVSIHLMLLFIADWMISRGIGSVFQYISCYSLSDGAFGPATETSRFNTSHVTLYHPQILPMTGKNRFQYISCYSLS